MPTDREKEIFYAAMDLPPGSREEFLARECAADASMRARIERLLGAHEQAEEFMSAPTIDAQRPAPEAGEPGELRLGAAMGPYTLESVLGEGGFGRVYLARQRQPVSRHVALKVLKAGMDSRSIVSRFETERQALALMDHPNVARVFDAGQTESGRPYFVMEFVRGEPITSFCSRHGLSIRQRLELFEQVCLAVQHAHHKGIIHRDLKPSNVLVTTVDGAPVPKVIDFGIAKAIGPRTAATMVTLEGHLVGTPAYMSPEQVSGGQVMDTRTDVYTLGVLLYEVLAGVLPFETERLEKTPLGSLAQIICEETPPKPSTRVMRAAEGPRPATRQLAARLRGDLDWIVMKAMEKEPARRYQTAYAMASDIRRYLRDEPVEAGPPSGAYRLKKFSQRHRGELLAAALVLVALLGGLASSLVFAARADEQRRLTARELEKSRELAAFTGRIVSGVDPAVARGADTTLLKKILADAVADIEQSPPQAPEVEAQMRELLGTALYKIADFAAAEEQFSRAVELAAASLGPDHERTLGLRQSLGQVYVETSRFDDARRELAGSLEGLERTRGADHPETITALFNLACVDRLQGQLERARVGFERVLELRRVVLGDHHPDTLSVLNSTATIMDELGEHEAAAERYREVIELQTLALGPDHPHTLATRNNLADALGNLGRLEEAAAELEEVLEAKRRVLEPGHPSLIVSLNNLSTTYRQLGRMDQAEAMLTEAVRVSRESLGERDMRTLVLTSNLAGLMVRTGRAAQAAESLEQALPMCDESLGETHPLALAMLAHRTRARLATEDFTAAAADAATLVERADRALAIDHPDRGAHRRLWGEALLRLGDAARAEAVLLEAYEMLAAASEPRPDDARETADLLAQACEAQQRQSDAVAWRSIAASAPDG